MNSKIEMVLGILMGLSLVVFGLNKFLFFISGPPLEGAAGELMNIYVSSGFMKIIGGLEIIGGLSLLAKKFVPLSLIILTAIMFNAVVFHLLYDLAGLGPAIGGLVGLLFLVYFNRTRFKDILTA